LQNTNKITIILQAKFNALSVF